MLKSVSFLDVLHRWFRLETVFGCAFFALLGIILLATGYILYAYGLAKYAGLPLRRMFGRPVRMLWDVATASYLVFLGLALYETYASRQAIAELEVHFGCPLTEVELSRQFYAEHPADPDFWAKLQKEYAEYAPTEEPVPWETSFYAIHPFAVIPENLHDQWKTDFQTNSARLKLEKMLEKTIPPTERNYADDQLLLGMCFPECSPLRELTRMEMQHIRYALEDNDIEEASAALKRIDACEQYFDNDSSALSYLVGLAIGRLRMEALEQMMVSGLCSEQWLSEQSEWLKARERQVEEGDMRVLHGEAVTLR